MPVDRCICHQISFLEIKEISKQKGLKSIEELQELKISCTNCKLCVPYIELMFETGETVFNRGARFRKS
jgi:bacterioferritin-associated ferredoxin